MFRKPSRPEACSQHLMALYSEKQANPSFTDWLALRWPIEGPRAYAREA